MKPTRADETEAPWQREVVADEWAREQAAVRSSATQEEESRRTQYMYMYLVEGGSAHAECKAAGP